MEFENALQQLMQSQQNPQDQLMQIIQQLSPEQIQKLQQELAGQSAPAASNQQMQQGVGSGLGSLPNAFMERLQQQQPQLQDELQTGAGGWLPLREQNIRMKPTQPRLETHPELFGLGFGVQR